MLMVKFCEVVYLAVDYDPKVSSDIVCSNFFSSEDGEFIFLHVVVLV